MIRMLTSLVAVILSACGEYPAAQSDGSEIMRAGELNPATAEADARQSLDRGDRRLLAVAGFSLEIPGTQLTASQAEAAYGIREIEGTSDMLDSPGAERANANARSYAETYNRTIIATFPNALKSH